MLVKMMDGLSNLLKKVLVNQQRIQIKDLMQLPVNLNQCSKQELSIQQKLPEVQYKMQQVLEQWFSQQNVLSLIFQKRMIHPQVECQEACPVEWVGCTKNRKS